MAKYCSSENCRPVCGYCKHYVDKGKRDFVGRGRCIKKDIKTDASEFCRDDFTCMSFND